MTRGIERAGHHCVIALLLSWLCHHCVAMNKKEDGWGRGWGCCRCCPVVGHPSTWPSSSSIGWGCCCCHPVVSCPSVWPSSWSIGWGCHCHCPVVSHPSVWPLSSSIGWGCCHHHPIIGHHPTWPSSSSVVWANGRGRRKRALPIPYILASSALPSSTSSIPYVLALSALYLSSSTVPYILVSSIITSSSSCHWPSPHKTLVIICRLSKWKGKERERALPIPYVVIIIIIIIHSLHPHIVIVVLSSAIPPHDPHCYPSFRKMGGISKSQSDCTMLYNAIQLSQHYRKVPPCTALSQHCHSGHSMYRTDRHTIC